MSIVANNKNIIVDSKENKNEKICLVFAGDVYLGGQVAQLCNVNEYGKIFNDLLPILKNSTSIINLESPLTVNKKAIKKDGPHLSAKPEYVKALQFAGIDIVALANNHIKDYGIEGIVDTLETCNSAGIKTVGAGTTQKDAELPLIISTNSVKIGILNFTENEFSIAKNGKGGAAGIDIVTNYYKILNLKKEVDITILIVHGGNERYPLPNPEMKKVYRFFADLGVTAIIGHHSHCASGYELYNNVPIFYGLGNFVFDSTSNENDSWYYGYLAKLSFVGADIKNIEIIPYEQCKSVPGAKLLTGNEKDSFLKKIEKYSAIISDDVQLNRKWLEFCSTRESYYLSSLFGRNRIERALIRRNIGSKIFMNNNAIVRLLNQIRCEAHREAIIKILEAVVSRQK